MTSTSTPSAKAMKENPVVLALDLSVAGTGYAVSDLDGMTGGVQKFTVKASEHQALRFRKFSQWLETMLQMHQPDIVLYEESSSQAMKSNAVIQCAVALSSRVEELCAVAGIPTRKTMPNSLKKAFYGVGTASKHEMQAEAEKLWPDYSIDRDKGGDECDARALAWCWQNKPEIFEIKLKASKKKLAA